MAKKKLKRFAEVETFPNVFQHMPNSPVLDDFHLKGNWKKAFFKNENPIVLELGCGKGEYTLGLARKHPEKNFIGVDLKGARIWKGAKEALEDKLSNVAFIRARIDKIETLFDKNEIDEIWITFPDPQPQKPRERKRLTSPGFISKYKTMLRKDGIIHLKTDNQPFYEYTLSVVKEENYELIVFTDNLYKEAAALQLPEELLSIRTFYENMFVQKGFNICYLKFNCPENKSN
jgi:tRNA (guanine-N7-)-methyltransferase